METLQNNIFKVGDWVKLDTNEYSKIKSINAKGGYKNWFTVEKKSHLTLHNPIFAIKVIKLPNKWAIKIDDENIQELTTIRGAYLGDTSGFVTSDPIIFNNGKYEFGKWYRNVNSCYEIITIEMLKDFLDKNDINNKLIGYKLKDETLIPVVQRLIEVESGKSYNCLIGGVKVGTGIKFISKYSPETIKILKHNKVFDIWYEPVYEEILKFNGYEIKTNKDNITVGCEELSFSDLKIVKLLYEYGLIKEEYNSILYKVLSKYFPNINKL